MIKLRNICKTYRSGKVETEALRGVDLTIETGEMVAIMGPSGSGKSTLLNILGGMDRATEGEYLFGTEELPVSKMTERELNVFRKKNISFIFQSFALLEEYTVYENVEMPLRARRVKKRKERILSSLKAVEIADKAKKKPCELSGGERQRCAIARAIVSEAPVLLADEPTGSLDQQTGRKIMDCFRKINTQGTTVVIITHDKAVADRCDRVIRLEDGRVEGNS